MSLEPPQSRRRAGDSVRFLLRSLGELLITTGVVVLLFAAYELWGTGVVTDREQGRLAEVLEQEWREPTRTSGQSAVNAVPAAPGSGIAVMRIPALGAGWSKVVVEGTGREELKKGSGRMEGTGDFGEVGNTVVSGHRTTYGAPFVDLDRLVPGDSILVETRSEVLTYRVYGSEVVRPNDVAVALPVPRRPGATPTRSLLTLTTCTPKYSARQRLIVYAELSEKRAKQRAPDE